MQVDVIFPIVSEPDADTKTGARVGDRIVFPSSSPKNQKVLNDDDVSLDTVYTIDSVVWLDGHHYSVFMDNLGDNNVAGGYLDDESQYIILSPRAKPAPPKFEPVMVTLESPDEVNLIYRLLGQLSAPCARKIAGGQEQISDLFPPYEALGKILESYGVSGNGVEFTIDISA